MVEFQAGTTVNQVSQHFGVHHKTIMRLQDKFAQTGHVKDRLHSGQPKLTTQRQDTFIRTYTLHNRFAISPEVNQAIQNAAQACRLEDIS